MAVAVPRRQHCFSWAGPPVAYFTCQSRMPDELREAGPHVAPDALPYPTLHQPCRLPVGPQATSARGCHVTPPLFLVGGPAGRSCPWLYRNATTLSRRWDRRPPPARGCTAMPPPCLVGGTAGRLPHVAVPHVTTLSRRWARRPPHARGCTAMPPHFLVGGPAGRLMHVAVPQCHHSL